MATDEYDGVGIRVIVLIIVMIFLLVSGALIFQRLEGLTFIDALYLSSSTLTTVGYGDIHPTSDQSKLFAIGYMLIGIMTTFYALGIISRFIFSRETPKLEERVVKALEAVHLRKNTKAEKLTKVLDDINKDVETVQKMIDPNSKIKKKPKKNKPSR